MDFQFSFWVCDLASLLSVLERICQELQVFLKTCAASTSHICLITGEFIVMTGMGQPSPQGQWHCGADPNMSPQAPGCFLPLLSSALPTPTHSQDY